jgi:subfamily B ATP-binding cassette protein MsbA
MTGAPRADVLHTYRRLLGYVRPYRLIILPAIIAIVVYAIVTATVPLFMEDIFELLQDKAIAAINDSQAAAENPLRIPLLISLAFGIRGAMDFLTVYGLSWVGRSAVRDMRAELFAKYLQLPTSYYDRTASGDSISKLTFNTEQVAAAISTAVVVLVRDTLLVVVMIIVMLSYNIRLTLALALVGPAIALSIGAMARAFRRYSMRIQNSMGDVTRVANQAFTGQKVIKIFAGQGYERERFAEINRQNFRFNIRLAATRAIGDSLTQYVVIVGVAGIIYLVSSGALSQDFQSPEFMGFITAVGILLSPLKRIVNSNETFQRGVAAADSLFAVLDEPVELTEDGMPLERAEGRIEYRGVGFRYTATSDDVLTNIDFVADVGTTTAFVGRSGSGKTTLVGLLPRFYEASKGHVSLDGHNIGDYRLADLRRQISYVGQDVVLFDDTIAANIAYGPLAVSARAEIERVADAAYVMEFAAALPDGLDSRVGENGTLLSGGQRQRVAIARAMLKDAPILILDEATSALDSESERSVQNALSELMRGRTTLVVAHRLSTIESADQIIVMRDGRIVEIGTHAELLAKAGYYANLYRLQFAD